MKRIIFFVLSLVGLVAACGTPPVAQPSPSAQPTPGPSATLPAGFAFADATGGQASDSTVSGVSVERHDGFDRFVVEFAGVVPGYEVRRQPQATFTRSPRGDQITLQGSAGVLIVMHSVTNWTTYAGPTSLQPGYPCLRQAQQIENYEGYQQWALGIQGTPALRVFTLTSPSRLVVDVTAG